MLANLQQKVCIGTKMIIFFGPVTYQEISLKIAMNVLNKLK
jgi:hypothetical protein